MGFRDRIRGALLHFAERVSPSAAIDPAWEIVPLPGDPSYIDRIVEAPNGDVWVIGLRSSTRLAWVDRGHGFESVPGIENGTIDLWPLSGTDIWFCGTNGHLAHYDGAWSPYVFEGFYYDFRDVVARSGADIWVAATRGVVHFDGTKFQPDNPPALLGGSIHSLWASDRDLLVPVYVVEDKSSHVARRASDGSWTREALGAGAVEWIHGSSANDIWATGMRDDAWHFDGKTWTHHSIGATRVYGVHVSAPDRAYLVGDAGTIVRWDGATWSPRSIGKDRLVSVLRPRDGRLLVGGSQLYRQRDPD